MESMIIAGFKMGKIMNNRTSEIVAAVDLGKFRISVIIAKIDTEDKIQVLGHGGKVNDGAVCDGEIINMSKAVVLFREALSQAEKMAGIEICSEKVFISVSGDDISCHHSVGIVYTRGDEGVVREYHVNKARENAKIITLNPEEMIIDAIGLKYMLDGTRRCNNPLNKQAQKIEAHVRIMSGKRSIIENLLIPLKAAGLTNIMPVFSGSGSECSFVAADFAGELPGAESPHYAALVSLIHCGMKRSRISSDDNVRSEL